MAVKIEAKYEGDGTVELVHGPTGSKITTDLPADNGGKGRTFSPTDLLASALASCVLTIMAKVAEREKIDLSGASIEIEKNMTEKPRRVGELTGTVSLPAGLSEDHKRKLSAFIKACPVHGSLHPDVRIDLRVE